MTDLRHHSFLPGFLRTSAADDEALSVVRLSHAARYMYGHPPSADVIVLESADALAPYRKEIDALAATSTDTNTQFESVTLAAAMENLQGGSSVRVALLWSDAAGDGMRVLIGLVPYVAPRGYFGLPVPVIRVWEHIHSFISTPLLRMGYEQLAIRRFLSFADRSGAALIQFPNFEADGAFARALRDVVELQHRVCRETDRHERAFLQSDLGEEEYLATHMRKKKRKEFNRLWNRLAELGDLDFTTHDGGADVGGWVKAFLQLEASGWKGKRGTALKARPDERKYFEQICIGAAAEGKLHCTEITLDGKPLAMLASFRAGAGVYTFKIAFDESYAKYSPGALLMMKLIGTFLRDERTAWVDSCAIPNHPMIDHIWAQRRPMRSVLVSSGNRFSKPLVSYVAAMMRIADLARARLRVVYARIRKEIEHDQAH
ncbi:hypothetical protein Plav_2997 [Parvibaculum lavamentivorans DS-1]|uniref:BioF2-like acetyltransferase domain-containing protein n=1 Tax=Parvibaculum lavamentivorans (strain DS-1 / DSM 13023 / NCIMB 13966) TaxID=402881 RepID=A7HXH1_PARL1|nr:GNAT family N-acetyltransferase [Parvibaculum lavamentivorans]ABS64604.1 hypothetical protein Plav_2997 [Parvibaculum lavamentivorans DS-1]